MNNTVNKETLNKTLKILKGLYPGARTDLLHETPLQLLVSTILSAQCTDERVNQVTPVLFKRFPDAETLANCDIEELKEIIRSTGFFNNKAKNIKAMAEKLVKDYQGRVPDNMEDLITLPGVARKTANVVLGNVFGKAEGVVVDTHVLRLSGLLGFSGGGKNAEKVEKDLMKLIPKDDWIWFSHALIHHGRKICKARKPSCRECLLNQLCPSAKIS